MAVRHFNADLIRCLSHEYLTTQFCEKVTWSTGDDPGLLIASEGVEEVFLVFLERNKLSYRG